MGVSTCVNPKLLVRALSKSATDALTVAVTRAARMQAPEVCVVHHLAELLRDEGGEAAALLTRVGASAKALSFQVEGLVAQAPAGSAARPIFSAQLFQLYEEAWVQGSLELGLSAISPAALLYALTRRPGRYLKESLHELSRIDPEKMEAAIRALALEQGHEERARARPVFGGNVVPLRPQGSPETSAAPKGLGSGWRNEILLACLECGAEPEPILRACLDASREGSLEVRGLFGELFVAALRGALIRGAEGEEAVARARRAAEAAEQLAKET